MKLSDLQAMGAIVPVAPIKREVKIRRPELRPSNEWADPNSPEFTGEQLEESVTVYIKRGAAIDAIEVMNAAERDQPFVAIHRSVVNEDGTPVFESLEQASRLAIWMAAPIFEAISDVAGRVPKDLGRRTRGGSKHPSPTAFR